MNNVIVVFVVMEKREAFDSVFLSLEKETYKYLKVLMVLK